jgi:hypothetical protein
MDLKLSQVNERIENGEQDLKFYLYYGVLHCRLDLPLQGGL